MIKLSSAKRFAAVAFILSGLVFVLVSSINHDIWLLGVPGGAAVIIGVWLLVKTKSDAPKS